MLQHTYLIPTQRVNTYVPTYLPTELFSLVPRQYRVHCLCSNNIYMPYSSIMLACSRKFLCTTLST